MDPFVAEIRIFPFNFAPVGWATCDGQILSISQNTALFSLLGTTYGGNGQSNFALPNLDARAPLHAGQGPGLSNYDLGESAGTTSETLLVSEIPAHNHTVNASASDATDQAPTNSMLASGIGIAAYAAPGTLTPLPANAIAAAGGNLPHNNMMPFLTLNFCIAMQGVFPPRS